MICRSSSAKRARAMERLAAVERMPHYLTHLSYRVTMHCVTNLIVWQSVIFQPVSPCRGLHLIYLLHNSEVTEVIPKSFHSLEIRECLSGNFGFAMESFTDRILTG
jgi:hypothetical protein